MQFNKCVQNAFLGNVCRITFYKKMKKMESWYFPSRGGAETEGFSNAGLAEFRGNPLQALAREICQNSLDAAEGSGKPVRVEFHKTFMEMSKFPGMDQMKIILDACQDFWGQD